MLPEGWWDGDPPRHHASCAPALWERVTDLFWGCQRGTGVLCVRVCAYGSASALQRDGEEAVGRLQQCLGAAGVAGSSL